MNILLVAATFNELNLVREQLEQIPEHRFDYLITGVGMIATTFALTEKLSAEQYDLVVNVGIAGAYDNSLDLGELVEVITDRFAEEVVEDGDELKDYEAIGLREANEFPFHQGILRSNYTQMNSSFKQVNAITVNTVHGNDKSIATVQERLNPQIESMEGAAFFYVCNMKKKACIQLRAISNYVEKRNRQSWKVDLALNNLANGTARLIQQIETKT